MVQVLVSMFDDVSTRELYLRRLDTQTTAFALMLGQMEVPESLGSEFEELDAELKRRDVVFNQHRVTEPIAGLLEVLHIAISDGTFEDIAARLAFGYQRRKNLCKLNATNPFFDEIEMVIQDDEEFAGNGVTGKVESTTFYFRIDLSPDEVYALVPDLAETSSNAASKTYSILRMTGNCCGRIDFVMQLHGNSWRLDHVIVTRL